MTSLIDQMVTAMGQAHPPAKPRRRGPRTEADYWELYETALAQLGRSTAHLMQFRLLRAPERIIHEVARRVWRRAWRCTRLRRRLDGMARPMRLATED